MSNDVLKEIQALLSEPTPRIPARVTNRLVLAALVQMSRELRDHSHPEFGKLVERDSTVLKAASAIGSAIGAAIGAAVAVLTNSKGS